MLVGIFARPEEFFGLVACSVVGEIGSVTGDKGEVLAYWSVKSLGDASARAMALVSSKLT